DKRPAAISATTGPVRMPKALDDLIPPANFASLYRNGTESNNTTKPSVALPTGALTARTTRARRATQRRVPSETGDQFIAEHLVETTSMIAPKFHPSQVGPKGRSSTARHRFLSD